ncbi:MAG: pseudouridine synthase [Planctomycetota bacterium]
MSEATAPDAPPPVPLRILHLDDDLVVVSKPPHMAVHRGGNIGKDEPVLLQTLRDQIGKHLYPVHRLDRPTSGIVAYGLSSEMAARLQVNLHAEDARKEYLVLVRGTTPPEFVSDRPLTDENDNPQPARTEFRTLAHLSRSSLCVARLCTGRMHQIRRHLAHLAHHVLGDSNYGKGRINAWFRESFGLPRLFLHAFRLRIRHPRSGEWMELVDPLPEDLRACLVRIPPSDGVAIDPSIFTAGDGLTATEA